jgi:hypothetical protein
MSEPTRTIRVQSRRQRILDEINRIRRVIAIARASNHVPLLQQMETQLQRTQARLSEMTAPPRAFAPAR